MQRKAGKRRYRGKRQAAAERFTSRKQVCEFHYGIVP
jgi:hypothetical protein